MLSTGLTGGLAMGVSQGILYGAYALSLWFGCVEHQTPRPPKHTHLHRKGPVLQRQRSWNHNRLGCRAIE
jgi:hypothetical protein